MNFKEQFKEGNNFILSPNGVISRTRYFLYALLLDILYRVFNTVGSVLGKEVSWIFYIVGLLIIPFIILKLFNYKKRAFSFLNHNVLSYLYSIIYIILGVLTQGYVYLLKLSNQKAVYELTRDPVFQQYANINVPSFVGNSFVNIIFYILCAVGFIMFLSLIFIPSRKKDNNEVIEKNETAESIPNTEEIREIKDINKYEKIQKNKIGKWYIIIPTIILYLFLASISYSEIEWRAYSWMCYMMNEEQINYINESKKFNYDIQMSDYMAKKKAWDDCIERNSHSYAFSAYSACHMSKMSH